MNDDDPKGSGGLLAYRGISLTLFASLFAAQAGLIAIAPVLAGVAADFRISTAAAGEVRMISGLAAGFTALWLTRRDGRVRLRTLMLLGAALVAGSSVGSALAPRFALLVLSQGVLGVGVALLVSAGTAAAAEWVPERERTRVLSWALIGQPAAWIVGMPLSGVLGEWSWRYAALALPVAGAAGAAVALARTDDAPPRRSRAGAGLAFRSDGLVRNWILAEFLAASGWTGTLVFAGALFTDTYGTSFSVTGAILATAAAAYVGGNVLLRRAAREATANQVVTLSLLLALSVTLFGAVSAGPAVSAVLLALAGFVAGGRTLLGAAFGLRLAPERRLALTSARAAALSFGYFGGSAVGGVALSLGGYSAVGVALGTLVAGAAITLLAGEGSVSVRRWRTA